MAKSLPSHKKLAGYLRCLIYDLYVLATTVHEMTNAGDFALTEVFKTAGLLKLRAVHDFFFRPNASDSIKCKWFTSRYGVEPPNDDPLKGNDWLTLQSVNSYVVHLDTARVTKKYAKHDPKTGKKKGDALPQPKFEPGKQAVIEASVNLMVQAYEYVRSVLDHADFAGLNYYGQKYWEGFAEKLDELT